MIARIYRIWKRLDFFKVGEALLVGFGALWLIIEILTFFNEPDFANKIKGYWWGFIIIGIFYAIIKNWPKSSFSFEVKNRDASIGIEINDIFKIDGAKIIPINNRLTTSLNGIIEKSNSILNEFITKEYNKNPQHLETDINNQIQDNNVYYQNQIIKNSNPVSYKIGTVVPIFQNETQYYLLCNASLNQQNRSKTTTEDLDKSLIELWAYLIHSGGKEHIIIPILGTGRGKITLTREEVIKEIVLSFLVSLSNDNYCEKLTIVIHPDDIKKYNLNIERISDFIRLQCENVNFAKNAGKPFGTKIEETQGTTTAISNAGESDKNENNE